MGAENEQSIDTHAETDQRGYLFRLSSRQLFILVGLICSGLLAYALEEANLSVVVDFVWIIGYVTTIFVVWFIWIRPLDLVGSSGQDTSLTEESDQPETAIDGHNDESEASALSGLRRRIRRQRKEIRPRYLPKKIQRPRIRNPSNFNVNL